MFINCYHIVVQLQKLDCFLLKGPSFSALFDSFLFCVESSISESSSSSDPLSHIKPLSIERTPPRIEVLPSLNLDTFEEFCLHSLTSWPQDIIVSTPFLYLALKPEILFVFPSINVAAYLKLVISVSMKTFIPPSLNK